MTTTSQLEELLRKYYEGATSPEEEVSLYLSLLEEPQDSPYRPDLLAIEQIMMAAAQLSLQKQEKPATQEVKVQKRWRIIPKPILTVAAALALLIAIGTSIWQPASEPNGSWRNTRPIDQEEVDREMARAFGLLNDCLSAGNAHYTKAHSTLEEVSSLLDASYQQIQPMSSTTPFASPFDISY